jgi:hypothetical protein
MGHALLGLVTLTLVRRPIALTPKAKRLREGMVWMM